MANAVSKNVAWVIKDFSTLNSVRCCSDPVLNGDYKWCLRTFPNRYTIVDHLCLFLEVADYESLPSGWKRYAKFRLTIVNQICEELSVQRESQHYFNQKASGWGFTDMISLTKLNAKDGGFLENDELLILAEIDAFEVIGVLDVSKGVSDPLEMIKQDDDSVESKDLLKKTPLVKESVDVKGFQVLPSQVESVRRIFEWHPDVAVGFRGKNKDLRTACMNFLLGLMEMLHQPLKEFSIEDLEEADIALAYLKNAGFKVDWLEMKLEEVKENIEKVLIIA